MGLKSILALALCAAVVAVATSAVLEPKPADVNFVQDDLSPKDVEAFHCGDVIEDSDDDDNEEDEEDIIDPETTLDGIALGDLTPKELNAFLEDEDNMAESELDILVLRNELEDRKSGLSTDDVTSTKTETRQKRWARVAFGAARNLFRGAVRGRLTSSGRRLTQQYTRRGSFGDAVRDFNRFQPRGQSSFSGRVNGRTGTVGNHRMTVRDGSSSGRPTLEIRSPRQDGSTFVRKFRYDN